MNALARQHECQTAGSTNQMPDATYRTIRVADTTRHSGGTGLTRSFYRVTTGIPAWNQIEQEATP